MQKDIGGNHSLAIPNINLLNEQKYSINPTKYLSNQDQFASYNNYNFSTGIYLEEEEEKYKQLSFTLSDIFLSDK